MVQTGLVGSFQLPENPCCPKVTQLILHVCHHQTSIYTSSFPPRLKIQITICQEHNSFSIHVSNSLTVLSIYSVASPITHTISHTKRLSGESRQSLATLQVIRGHNIHTSYSYPIPPFYNLILDLSSSEEAKGTGKERKQDKAHSL